MININETLLDQLTLRARLSSRRRMTHNFHSGPDDTLQRMLNALEPGTYVRPHKHELPDKREVFFAMRGTLCVIEFNDASEVSDYTILNSGIRNYGVEIPQRTWHTIISLESGSVAYEVKDGPYDPANDKNFASWAPAEGSTEAEDYLQSLIKKLGLKVG
ncbi:MAG: WbuC family cupin fold metalloprotein [Bacteroidota bacterium]